MMMMMTKQEMRCFVPGLLRMRRSLSLEDLILKLHRWNVLPRYAKKLQMDVSLRMLFLVFSCMGVGSIVGRYRSFPQLWSSRCCILLGWNRKDER